MVIRGQTWQGLLEGNLKFRCAESTRELLNDRASIRTAFTKCDEIYFMSVAGKYTAYVVEQYPLKGGLEIIMVSHVKTVRMLVLSLFSDCGINREICLQAGLAMFLLI